MGMKGAGSPAAAAGNQIRLFFSFPAPLADAVSDPAITVADGHDVEVFVMEGKQEAEEEGARPRVSASSVTHSSCSRSIRSLNLNNCKWLSDQDLLSVMATDPTHLHLLDLSGCFEVKRKSATTTKSFTCCSDSCSLLSLSLSLSLSLFRSGILIDVTGRRGEGREGERKGEQFDCINHLTCSSGSPYFYLSLPRLPTSICFSFFLDSSSRCNPLPPFALSLPRLALFLRSSRDLLQLLSLPPPALAFDPLLSLSSILQSLSLSIH